MDAGHDKNYIYTALGLNTSDNSTVPLKTNSAGDAVLVEALLMVNDYKVAVTGADTTPAYLSSKIVDSSTVTWTVNNPGANETYTAEVVPGSNEFYNTFQSDGVDETQRTNANFDTFFTLTDDAGNDATIVSIDTLVLGADSTLITTLTSDTTFLENIANSSIFVDALVANAYFTTELAANSTFIDALVANTYFTTELANNATFIATLTANSTFITDISTEISGSVSVVTDGVTITGDGTTGDPLTAVGGNSISLTANEDITAGDTVAFASNIAGYATKAAFDTRRQTFNNFLTNVTDVVAATEIATDKYAFVTENGTNQYVFVGTFDRDTQTWSLGTPVSTSTVGGVYGNDVVKLDTDKFAVATLTAATNPYVVKVTVCTVSGTTVTVGGNATFSEPSTDNANTVSLVQLDTDRFAMLLTGTQAGSHCDLFQVTVSGTTPTIGTQQIIDSNTQRVGIVEKVDSNKVAILHETTLIIATVAAGVWTVGTPVTLPRAGNTERGILGLKSNATNTVFVSTKTTTGGGAVGVWYYSISGNTPTLVSDTSLPVSVIPTALNMATDNTNVYLYMNAGATEYTGFSKITSNGAVVDYAGVGTLTTSGYSYTNAMANGSDYYIYCDGTSLSDDVTLRWHVQGNSSTYVGIAQSTAARGAAVPVITTGISSVSSDLTPGALYYPSEGGLVNTTDSSLPFILSASSPTTVKV